MNAAASTVRVMTWNIHGALGRNRRFDLAKIIALIKRHDPDVIALQEVDVRTRRGGFVDEPLELATALGMHYVYAASIKWDEGPFQYVTSNLAFSKGYLKEGEDVQVANFLGLFRIMGEHMKRTGPDHFYSTQVEFPDGTRGEVYAVQNESGRYTAMLPEDY